MKGKPTVLFETEGSYPFNGGGVSTWAHILCSTLEDKVDFDVLALTGTPFVEPRYRLSSNIKSVTHVPLWGSEEPAWYYDRTIPFSQHIHKKSEITDQVIESLFFPVFKDFLDCVFDPFRPVYRFGDIIYGMWKYFQHFDYKQTLAHSVLWEEFKSRLYGRFENQQVLTVEMPRLSEATFGMRWLYHFMMPLAVPVPQADVTHATLAGFPALMSIIAKYECGTPIVLTDHGVFIRERLINVSRSEFSFFSKKLLVDLSIFVTRSIYHHADLIAPVTSINKKWEKKFEGREEQITPIYNGIDPDVFRPAPKPASTSDRPTVVAAAQVFPLKDIETMIRSCELVRHEIPDVQYILYGSLKVDEPYVERCQKLVRELDLSDHFIFGGFHNTASMIYNEGDISILSSISEGFPYTVIESMSCGRPVVSTDVGGIREAMEGCGILCKPRSAKELSDGVIALLNDDDLRVDMGNNARERVLLNYTIPQSVDSYYDVYKKFQVREKHPLKDRISTASVQSLIKDLYNYA